MRTKFQQSNTNTNPISNKQGKPTNPTPPHKLNSQEITQIQENSKVKNKTANQKQINKTQIKSQPKPNTTIKSKTKIK